MAEERRARFVESSSQHYEDLVGRYGVAAYSPHYDDPDHVEFRAVYFTPHENIPISPHYQDTYYVSEDEIVWEGEEGYESDERRYYECGCCPADEEFCKVGDFLVWTSRENMNLVSVADGLAPEQIERAKELEAAADLLMYEHLHRQEVRKQHTDVDLSLPKYREGEADGDYDETMLGR